MNRSFARGLAAVFALALYFPALADIAPPPDPCTLDPDSAECGARGGSGVQVYEEYHKRLRSNEMVTPLGSDVFGDNVSLYNGSTEFRVVDIDLPGNGGPPMQLARRFKVDSRKAGDPLGGFGAWDIDVPHLSGTFTGTGKWNTGLGGSTQRCSTAWQPPLVANFERHEVWSGFQMHLPGQGDREFYPVHAPLNHPQPTDGNAYRWIARDNLRLRCLDVTSNGYFGQGFVAIDAEGTTYHFDVGLERSHGSIQRRISGMAVYSGPRTRVYLMASKVTDRFGNWVRYHYSGVGLTARLTSLSAGATVNGMEVPDGRSITLQYDPNIAYGRIASASATGRTWTYAYHAGTFGAPGRHMLLTVTLPDQSFWHYGYSGHLIPEQFDPENPYNQGCPIPFPPDDITDFTLNVTHPAGAAGAFEFRYMQHYRSGVPTNACNPVGDGISWRLDIANYLQNFALTRKTVAGVGVPSMAWTYDYERIAYGRSPHQTPAACMDAQLCPESKKVTVTQPDNSTTDYDFGVRFSWNDGRLLKTTTKAAGGAVLRTETSTYVTEAEAPGMPFPNEIAAYAYAGSDDWATTRIRPVKSTMINQQSVNFGNTVNTFDNFARPTSVTKASFYGNKTEYTSYWDVLNRWVVGQINSVRVPRDGVDTWPVGHLFDPITLKPSSTFAFHKLVDARTYHPNGQLKTVSDPSSVKKTTLSNYKCGIPQTVTYHDGSGESAIVNDRGEITSVTDAMGYTTSYGYDLMGRVNAITYPGGDSTAWTPTSIAFEKIGATEYGLPANHWRQTVATGNARAITYFDGLWRPVLSRTYDTANELGTRRMVQRRFDHANRETLVSYPQRTITAYNSGVNSTTTQYDALGRPTLRQANSELGLLSTTYSYISLYRTQVTDPKGNITTTRFQAFDQPSTDAPTLVQTSAGTSTVITRDLFGKPRHIQRSGLWNGSTLFADRRFVYDANERLCKTYDPEAGWTVMDYDASNNLAWTTTGSSLSSLTDCQRANVAAGDKSSRSYDGRNRLITLDHPVGTDDITHSYFADGALKTIATPNGGTWTYGYNKRRLMTSENLVVNGMNLWNYLTYDGNGHVSHVAPPGGALTPYSPNALGEPTQVGNYATGVSYHPNGSVAGFTYTNGIVHSETLNTRQLPAQRYEQYNGTVFMNLHHTYDANGNLVYRLDADGGVNETREMDYDGLDRLTWADAPGVLGSAAYTYDPLDNLRQIDFAGGARAPQTDVYRYNANNRLYEIYRTNGQQNQTVPYHHDVRGNMTLRGVGGHSHSYDRANRMLTANTGASTENYRYDGHGRRTTITRSGTIGTNTHFYTRDGKLVYERTPSGTVTRHIHLGNRLVATVTGGTISQHTDTLGSIVRRTNLIRGTVGTTVYEPYGSLGVGIIYEQRPGFTGHTTDAATTLSYMQQRYYDSTAMRFLSVDPVPVGTTEGSNFNRYWYANNNPYKYVDPDGREAGPAFKAIHDIDAGISRNQSTPNEIGAGAIADFIPVIGDLKGIAAAIADPSAVNVAAAVVGLGGPVGDAAAKAIKGAGNVADAARGTIHVDSKGNAIPTPAGGGIQGSPDGRYVQAVDAKGNPTGVRIDGGHKASTHSDPRAQQPHAHVPGVTNEDGTPWLPVNQK
jgi:RHS repeat-associated protein